MSSDEFRAALARSYVASAKDDWAWVEAGVADAALPASPMGFHAQQAIEKLLKALLITFGVEPEEHHNIARLVQQVARLDRAVADAISATTQLTPYAVHRRYPPRNPLAPHTVKRNEVLKVVRLARDAYPILETAINARLEGLDGKR
jgi:HEPN domain-containing protein